MSTNTIETQENTEAQASHPKRKPAATPGESNALAKFFPRFISRFLKLRRH